MKSILRNFKILFSSHKLQIQETNLILYYRILRIFKWLKIYLDKQLSLRYNKIRKFRQESFTIF